MSMYNERLENIEYNTNIKLTADERLALAFKRQETHIAINLMDNEGANPRVIIDLAKQLGGWKMSMLQDNLVRLAYEKLDK